MNNASKIGCILFFSLVIVAIFSIDDKPIAKASSNFDEMTLLETYSTFEDKYIGTNIYVLHDDKRNVTCWKSGANYEGSISCIPDSQLP